MQITKNSVKIYLSVYFFTINFMKTDIASSREYIARRGHMVAFLLCALSITGWINNFQAEINEANIAYIDQVLSI